MQSVLDSLDRKMDRRHDTVAKKMCFEVAMGIGVAVGGARGAIAPPLFQK